MTYAMGAIAGLIFGGIAGFLKDLLIWQKYLKAQAAENSGTNSLGELYGRAFISYAVNILVLAAAFFMRNAVPFDGIAFLIGTAVALSVMNRVMALRQKKQECQGKESR